MMGSQYDAMVSAAETLKRELSLLKEDSTTDEENKEEEEEEEDVAEDEFSREISFLKSYMDYYQEKGIYPFDTIESAKDFSENWVGTSLSEFYEENHKYLKKYNNRVRHVCKEFQHLDPRQQEAFNVGNKIWGSQRELKRDTYYIDDMEDEEHEDPLDKFPLVKESFKFGVSDDLKIPVTTTLEDDIKRGLTALGSTRIKHWNDTWRQIRLKELLIFRDKLFLLTKQTKQLLREIDNMNSSGHAARN